MDCESQFVLYHSLFVVAARKGGRWANTRRLMGNPFAQDHQRHATDEQIAEGAAYAWQEWCRRWEKESPETEQDAAKLAESVARRVAQQVNRGSRFGARPGSRLDTYDNAARQSEETLHGQPWRDEEREAIDEDYGAIVVLDGGTETPYVAVASFGRRDIVEVCREGDEITEVCAA